MGLVPDALADLIRRSEWIGGLKGCRMMELGNQQMYGSHNGIAEGLSAKAYFLACGVKEHVSIDRNGLLGSLQFDLSKPIEIQVWDNAFDLVTDFGTSEHVGPELFDLYNARANCHRWCRPGGMLMFNNPLVGTWPWHGHHHFTAEHYMRLALGSNWAGYDLVQLSIEPFPYTSDFLGYDLTRKEVRAVLVKRGSAPFVSFDDYQRTFHAS